jgi:hypothetical protein
MNVQQYNRQYYELHKAVLIERSRLWRAKNRGKLATTVACVCGGRYLATNKTNRTQRGLSSKKNLTNRSKFILNYVFYNI